MYKNTKADLLYNRRFLEKSAANKLAVKGSLVSGTANSLSIRKSPWPNSWDVQYLQHYLVTRGLIATKDIDEERVACGPLIKLPHTIRMTTELAKQKLTPILQAAGLPDVQDTTVPAIQPGTVSCQAQQCIVLCHSAPEHLPWICETFDHWVLHVWAHCQSMTWYKAIHYGIAVTPHQFCLKVLCSARCMVSLYTAGGQSISEPVLSVVNASTRK